MIRVLVVDDNDDIAEALSALLQLQGCEVQVARNGEESLLIAQTFQPRLVFMDIGLPDMNGYEVARRIRLNHGDDIRLVALTGFEETSDEEKALAAGFDLHLLKPADIRQIRDIVQQL